jgi:ketosteroid isomerase-like protein
MKKGNGKKLTFTALFILAGFAVGSVFTIYPGNLDSVNISQTKAYGADSADKRLAAIETRIQTLEDLEAIKQLQYRYKNAFMQARWDEVIDCFSEDATLDIKPDGTNVGKGMAEVKRQFGNMAKAHVGSETDFMYHPIISVNGNKAGGTWMVTDTMHIKNQGEQYIYGIYTVEYVKVDGKWKISLLRHRHRKIEPAESLGPPPD